MVVPIRRLNGDRDVGGHGERKAQAVEPGAEVGACGGDADSNQDLDRDFSSPDAAALGE